MADITQQKIYTLHVHNMYCNACVALTESELKRHPKISHAKSRLDMRTVEIRGDFGDMTLEAIARELTAVLSQHKLATAAEQRSIDWKEFMVAIPFAFGFVAFFVLLQRFGIVNLVTADRVSYGTAILVGIIASLSTCMAVVGGLALSVGSNFAKSGDRVKPQLYFHIGRLLSFFVFGGIIGALGAVFELSATMTMILSIVVGVLLLVLGINLLDIIPWMRRLQPTLPHFIGSRVHGLQTINHACVPFALGAATFFLPCGFTQSMQVYTLTTGSFWVGAATMLAFAFGTLPVLAALSFGSIGITSPVAKSIFFKIAGLIVIAFAFFNIITALVAAQIIPPIFNFL